MRDLKAIGQREVKIDKILKQQDFELRQLLYGSKSKMRTTLSNCCAPKTFTQFDEAAGKDRENADKVKNPDRQKSKEDNNKLPELQNANSLNMYKSQSNADLKVDANKIGEPRQGWAEEPKLNGQSSRNS